jgi:Phosphoenolpyruvate phosphomutase
VLPNPWDVGTARLFANLGFRGLATTSAGLAFSLGRRDGNAAVRRDEDVPIVTLVTPMSLSSPSVQRVGPTAFSALVAISRCSNPATAYLSAHRPHEQDQHTN